MTENEQDGEIRALQRTVKQLEKRLTQLENEVKNKREPEYKPDDRYDSGLPGGFRDKD